MSLICICFIAYLCVQYVVSLIGLCSLLLFVCTVCCVSDMFVFIAFICVYSMLVL